MPVFSSLRQLHSLYSTNRSKLDASLTSRPGGLLAPPPGTQLRGRVSTCLNQSHQRKDTMGWFLRLAPHVSLRICTSRQVRRRCIPLRCGPRAPSQSVSRSFPLLSRRAPFLRLRLYRQNPSLSSAARYRTRTNSRRSALLRPRAPASCNGGVTRVSGGCCG